LQDKGELRTVSKAGVLSEWVKPVMAESRHESQPGSHVKADIHLGKSVEEMGHIVVRALQELDSGEGRLRKTKRETLVEPKFLVPVLSGSGPSGS
jgi:hypothetical protein